MKGPSADRLAGCAMVSEERGLWIAGRMLSEPHAFFELSYENHVGFSSRAFIHPEVLVTYLGVHLGKKIVAEFELGRWTVKPIDDDIKSFIINVMGALRNFRPFPVVDRNARAAAGGGAWY